MKAIVTVLMRSFAAFVFYMLFSTASYSQEVFFFRDSNNPGYYDSGLAFRTSPSSIEQAGPSGDKIPTSTTAFQGSNSLRLRWTSRSGGDWSALVIAPGFPFQNIANTDTLSFWAYAPSGLSKAHWPVIFLEGAPGATKSRKYPLADYAGDLVAQTWTLIKVPLNVLFQDPMQTGIQFTQIKAVIFGQGVADGQEHVLLIDEVKTYKGAGSSGSLQPPATLTARGYDRHIELRWPLPATLPAAWRIYRSSDRGQTFAPVKNLAAADSLWIDFHATAPTDTFTYVVRAINSSGQESGPSPTASAALQSMTDEQLLDMVQAYTFRYFWDFAHPVSGLIRERNTSGNLVTMGGSGFGIMAILVGIERGWITRQQGLNRLRTMVDFLEKADRFKGIFPHWMDGTTGKVIPFSTQDNGGDIVESAFLFQGLLTARMYFDQNNAEETALRNKITTLWQEADWNWYRQNQSVVYWHWSPNYQFAMNLPVRGWNETLAVYLLGIASPTHPLPVSTWQTGWGNNGAIRNGNSYFGFRLPLGGGLGGPLFFAHYSFMGFDPRNIQDQYANYFEQNRNQSLINRAYCIANPKRFPGYGPNCWGLTASDNPFGYKAHEPSTNGDNGTIAPTGALSSMPYTPEESIAALKYFYREQGARLWGPMGFYDAFNLQENWFASSYLAIDQGPIIGMIENYRSGLLWNTFMKDPEIRAALDRIGFTATPTNTRELRAAEHFGLQISPNPASSQTWLNFRLNEPAQLQLALYDMNGQLLQNLGTPGRFQEGQHTLQLDLPRLPPGSYVLRFLTEDHYSSIVFIIQP